MNLFPYTSFSMKVTPPAGSPTKAAAATAAELELDLDNLNLDDVQVDPSGIDLDDEEDLLGDD